MGSHIKSPSEEAVIKVLSMYKGSRDHEDPGQTHRLLEPSAWMWQGGQVMAHGGPGGDGWGVGVQICRGLMGKGSGVHGHHWIKTQKTAPGSHHSQPCLVATCYLVIVSGRPRALLGDIHNLSQACWCSWPWEAKTGRFRSPQIVSLVGRSQRIGSTQLKIQSSSRTRGVEGVEKDSSKVAVSHGVTSGEYFTQQIQSLC